MSTISEGKSLAVRDFGSEATTLIDLIGSTPLVDLGYWNSGARILAKAEFKNPGGSVKDRICLSMIQAAEDAGVLKPGASIVEATSGNTGIGLAMISAVKGYHCVLTMPKSMSEERVRLLRAYGADLRLCSDDGGMAEALLLAEDLQRQLGAFAPQQFENPANPAAHVRTTGPEILQQVAGQKIAAFVAGVGTGGTISGTGRVLKQADSSTQIVAVEPAKSPVISGGKPGGHGIQGIGAGFIPDTLDLKLLDEVVTVTDDEAWECKDLLARKMGLLVGISAGANVAAAAKIAARYDPNSVVVTVLCDTGERYLSVRR